MFRILIACWYGLVMRGTAAECFETLRTIRRHFRNVGMFEFFLKPVVLFKPLTRMPLSCVGSEEPDLPLLFLLPVAGLLPAVEAAAAAPRLLRHLREVRESSAGGGRAPPPPLQTLHCHTGEDSTLYFQYLLFTENIYQKRWQQF